MTETLKTQILEAVDTLWEDQIAFTQDLVRYPSLRGQEHTVQNFLHDQLANRGYAMDRWAIDENAIKDHPGFSPIAVSYDNALNVVGTHTPRHAVGRSLILNGHVDVVPEGPYDMWSRNPFDPAIEGDWMYGRGGADMKAGVAANIFAMDALRCTGHQPAATVYIQSVTEEECTGNGALSALVRGYTADAVLIPEPMDDSLVRANVGVLWFQIELRGKPVHVRDAGSGSNAILSSWTIISALKDLEAKWNARQSEVRYFEDVHHPINLNVGKIEGGDWASAVPAWCRLDCRISIFPGDDPKEAAAEIEQVIRSAAAADPYLSNSPPRVTFNGFYTRGYVQEEGSDAEEALDGAYRRIYDKPLPSAPSTAYLDGRVFALYANMPTLVFGPYSENIHGFDERVSLESLKKVTKTIALFIAEWCGVERIDASQDTAY
ncbi:MAG: ArgE/DapE family deacylase [Pseudomonadota bacterium]